MIKVPSFLDTFQQADGAVSGSISDSGHTVLASGANLTWIYNNLLTIKVDGAGETGNPQGGGYTNINLKRSPQSMKATYSFVNNDLGGNSGLTSSFVFITSSLSHSLKRMSHFYTSRFGYDFQLWYPNDAGDRYIISGTWATPLPLNTELTFEIEFYNGALVCHCPDGITRVATDPRLSFVVGQYITYQPEYSANTVLGTDDPKILVSRIEAVPQIRPIIYA